MNNEQPQPQGFGNLNANGIPKESHDADLPGIYNDSQARHFKLEGDFSFDVNVNSFPANPLDASLNYQPQALFSTGPPLDPNLGPDPDPPSLFEPGPGPGYPRRASAILRSVNPNATASSGVSIDLQITMSSSKRSSPDDHSGSGGTPSKQLKIENADYSKIVQDKLQVSTRTAQACDRCKVRKIKCDGLDGTCSPCMQASAECTVVDRNSGRALPRGYVNRLEQQNATLIQRNQELERQALNVGNMNGSANGYQPSPPYGQGYSQNPRQSQRAATGPRPNKQALNQRALPAFLTQRPGDNYLGVSAGNELLSTIKGTALSILGFEIDIANYLCDDTDEPCPDALHGPLYNKSYQAFLLSTLNINPMHGVDLPPRDEGEDLVKWYFHTVHPFLPILHRPSFLKLFDRFYTYPNLKYEAWELATIHMVFAIMYFQYAARKPKDENEKAVFTENSNKHYHYSLSLFYQLSSSHTFQDIQALTLICAHLRNFPKPGASWMLTQTTMALAIQLGIHRSASKWAPDARWNALEVEMRKRVFWSLFTIDVTLSGKLGRPMHLRMGDFDVECPEELDDNLLSEDGLNNSAPAGECIHRAGLQAFRIIPLYHELYSTIYAVRRRPETYVATVRKLEAKLQVWEKDLPEDFKVKPDAADDQASMWAHFAQAWAMELRILLHHPSVSMTTDPEFMAESLKICVEASRTLLTSVRQMQRFNCLDTTWYSIAVYVMAFTTILYHQWGKEEAPQAANLSALKVELNLWLGVLGQVGELVGAQDGLREALRPVAEKTLAKLYRKINDSTDSNNKSTAMPRPSIAETSASRSFSHAPSENPQMHQATTYPAATQYYQAGTATAGAMNPISTPPISNGWHAQQAPNPDPMGQPWTQFVGDNFDNQDDFASGALMQLGAGPGNGVDMMNQAAVTMGNMSGALMGQDMAQHIGNIGRGWPQAFHMGSNRL